MAIISIPSSIGGVTVPGLATNGPLGALFNNPFGQQNLTYPRDLQSTARGHYVTFTIKDINPIGYNESDKTYTFGGAAKNLITAGFYKVRNALPAAAGTPATDSTLGALDESSLGQAITNVNDTPKTTTNEDSVEIAIDKKLEKETYTTKGRISLYIPETMQFTYGMQYSDASLTSILGKTAGAALSPLQEKLGKSKSIIGKAVSSISKSIDGKAGQLLLKEMGLAVNPKLQLLFEGIGFRSYQMVFTFTPYSQQEAEQVKNIINTFKTYASPRQVEGVGGGMFFIPPAVFEPKFYFNGKENKNINAVTQSVITNIDVNYAPNGWSTFDDGKPVQTVLTLQFKEVEILDRQTMQTGNY